ncbi:EsV-1-33 [Ectocarpus siliculosus virus 1]|uniref:EsV-1-33 n=1 Tax=Ectocarpus siliculosus virus 1 (isolate New Zealand/Kaikoura/1988) TaxID=654926 RepID=Q8QKW3_ESV1K|nr:EsV-1-33 [Ectocarpus siliculosus virus 1]AAK14459.1 EsV-1-33 [Ectocarpus siliculosus virus 1]
MTLTVAIVLIITSLVAFILYRKSSDNTGSQNLGMSAAEKKKKTRLKKKKMREERLKKEKAREKILKEQRRKLKDPCEWVKRLKKL